MAVGKENSLLLILLLAFLLSYTHALGSEKLKLPNEPQRFTTHPAQERNPAVSTDGKWVLFASNRAGNWDIFIKSTSGGAPIRLTDDLSDEYSPAWAPDGKSFVYVSHEEDALGDIWLMKLRFAGAVRPGKSRRINARLGYDGEPVFTPDGKAVCFVSDRSSQREIWLYYLKERKTVKLTGGGGISPAISSDGTIAFIRISPEFPFGEIFILPDYRQSTPDTQLTYSHKINASPSFSPAGDALVVSRVVRDSDGDGIITPDDNHTLWIIPLKPDSSDYKAEFQLTHENESHLQPCWGSDGNIYSAVVENGSVDVFRFNQSGFFDKADSSEAQLSLARQYTRQPDDFLLGLESAKGYYPVTPQSGEALYLKGEVFSERGDLKTAKTYFLRVMRDYGHLHELSFMAKIGYLQVISSFQPGVDGNIGMVGNPSGFVTALEDIIAQRPPKKPRLKALALKADALFQMGVFSEALEIYAKIIAEFADFPESCAEAQYRLAQIYSRYGETSEIVQSYLKILKDYPTQEIWNRRAIERIFELELGGEDFAGLQRIMNKYRNYPRLSAAAKLEMARRLAEQGQFELALAEYEPLIDFPGEDPLSAAIRAAAAFEMADIRFERSEFVEALDLLEKLAAASARFKSKAIDEMHRACIDRGEELLQGGDLQLALAMFDQARKIAPQKLEGHRGYILAMNKMGRGAQACRQYADSAQAHPGDAALLYCQGLAMSYIGEANPAKLAKSTQLIESALALDYRMIPAYLTLSYNYQAMEELERTGGVKIGFFRRVYGFTVGVTGNFWRAITFQGEPEEFSGYEIAINTLNQALALNDEKTAPEMETALLLNLANNYYSLGEFGFKNAYESYMKMLALDASFKNPQAEASIRERVGRSAMFIDLFKEGRAQIKTAEEIYRRLGDDNSVFRILLMRAELEWRAGDPETSNNFFKKALKQAEVAGIEIPQELYFSGIAFNYYQSGEWEMALDACERSLDELSGRKITRRRSPYKIGFKVLGLTLPLRLPIGFLIGDFALGESRAAEGLSLGDVKSLALSIQSSARTQRGEYSEAGEILREKLELAEYKRDYEEAAACLNQLAGLEYLRGEYSQAVEYILKSIDESESASREIGVYKNIINLQILRSLLPSTSPLLKKINRAINRTMREIASEDPESPRRLLFIPEKSAILTAAGNDRFNYGLFLLKASSIDSIIEGYSNIQSACELWEDALELSGTNRLNRQTFILKTNQLCASALMGDLEYGIEQLNSLAASASENGFSGLLWRLYKLKGEILLSANTNDTSPAETSFRTSAAYLEGLPPAKYPAHPSIEAGKTALYQRLVSLNLEAGDSYEAFNFAERLSGLRFAELTAQREFEVKGERQKYFWGSGGGSINYFRFETARIESQLQRSDLTPGERTTLIDELHNNQQEYLADLQTVREEDPEFASLFSVSPVSIHKIQTTLEEGELLIRLFKLEDEYHLWALDSYDMLDFRLPVSADSLRSLIETADSIGTPPSDSALAIIGGIVLSPLAEMLEFDSNLMLVLDGVFDDLSFENLIWNDEPLGRNYRIAYSPSASFFYYARAKRILSGNNLLCLNCNSDSIEISDEFNLLEAPSPLSAEMLFEAFEKTDIAIIKPDFEISRAIPLNAEFTIPENEGEPFTLRLYQPFAFDAPLSLLILNGVNLEGSIGRMFLRSLCFAGVSGFIAIDYDAEPSGVKAYLTELIRNLPGNSALEAHRLAVNAVAASDSTIEFPIAKYWGDCGMTPEQAKEYANRNFRLTVIKGNSDLDSANYAWAARYYRQAMEMARRIGNRNAQFNLLRLQMQAADSSQDWESALSFQREILDWGLKPVSAAVNEANLARYYILSGRIDSAQALANSVIDDLIEMELSDKAAQTSLYLAQTLEKNGYYIQAEALAGKAFNIQKKAGLPDTLKTELFRGKLLLEAELYEKSAAILEPLVESGGLSREDAALGNLWLGRCLLETIDYFTAIDRFKLALESLPEGTVEIEARALQGLADCHYKLGDYTASLDFIHRAREIIDRTEAAADYYSFNTEGLIYMKMGRLTQAEKALLKALETVETTPDRASESSIRKNLTFCFLESGKTAPALAQARRTLELDRSADKPSSSACDRLIIAGLLIKAGDFPSASEQLKSAAELNLTLNDPRITAKIALAQAYIDCRQNELTEAEAKIPPVLETVERIGLPELQWRLNYILGEILAAQGETEKALARFTAAAEIAASLILPAEDWETRTIFLDNPFAPFDEIIGIQVDNGEHIAALQTAEKARHLQTKFTLFKHGVTLRSGEPYAEAEAGLRGKLLALNHKIEFLKINRQNPEIIPHIAKTIETVHQEYSGLLTAIQRQDSLYYDLIAGSEPDIELAQLLLHIGEAMVYYHIGNGVVFIWALAQDTIASKRIDIDPERLNREIDSFRQLLEGILNTGKNARWLYDKLLAPLEKILTGYGALVFVPGGRLYEIPFDALLDNEGRYCIDRWEISYAFGLREFIAAQNQKGSPEAEVTLFAVPDFPGTQKLEFAPLEVESIAFTLPEARLMVGNDATSEAVSTAIRTADIIHLACHGRTAPDTPLEFALLIESQKPAGTLSTRQVYNMKSGAGLVFLSACGENGGNDSTEAFISLNHAFRIAGSGAVISSLWKADDLAAGVIAKRFYRQMAEGASLRRALWNAKLSVKEEINAHPAYWAGFQLYGNRNRLQRFNTHKP